jgi:hypothetical protein
MSFKFSLSWFECILDKENKYKSSGVEPEGKSNLKDSGVEDNIILKCCLKNTVGHVKWSNVAQDMYMCGLL